MNRQLPLIRAAVLGILFSFCSLSASAQANPVPLINQPLVPAATTPGAPAFTLTVNGTGFVSGATVKWNGAARATTFVNSSQLTASISAADVAAAGTALVTVTNPAPGGGDSNSAYFDISPAIRPLTFERTDYVTGGTPLAILVADLNGDGKPDVAITNQNPLGDNVSIHLGHGDGTFQGFSQFATGAIPFAFAAGDFNGDGKLDLAVANNGDGTVSILLGNGDGTFQKQVAHSAGSSPTAIAAGDFNADGKLDLAVADAPCISSPCPPGAVSILLGNGDGTFQAPVGYFALPSPISIVAGDFNGDGKLDLAVSSDTGVSLLLGNGDGTFQPHRDFPTPHRPVSLIAADFNGDGRLDLAAADDNCQSATCPPGEVAVLLGNGDGTFQPAVVYPAGQLSFAVIAGDFDEDGKLDLATANFDATTFSILFGNGDGTFQTNVDFPAASGLRAIAAGDFNGDGRMDLVAPSDFRLPGHSLEDSVSIFLQAGALTPAPASLTFPLQNVGTTSPPQTVTLTNTGSAVLAIGLIDFIGADGNDFAETNNCPGSLAIGGNCQVAVTFTPTGGGTRSANLQIANSGSSAPADIPLSGASPGSAVTLAPSGIQFSSQAAGTASAPQAITITNSGNASLIISSIAIGGNNPSVFGEINTCIGTFSVGGSCAINVTFSPPAAGNFSADILVTDNAPDSPQSVPLSGAGTASAVSFNPSSLSFTNVTVGTTSAPQSVTLINTGSSTLTISGIAITGANASDFGETNNCPSSVAAGANCAINVAFTPSAAGTRNAALTVTDSAPGGPQSAPLTGDGASFIISSSSGSAISAVINAGQTATYNFNLVPEGGFNGTVMLTCAGAPAQSICSPMPNVVTLNPAGPFAETVLVTTTAPSKINVHSRSGLPPIGELPALDIFPALLPFSLGLVLLALFALQTRRGGRRSWMWAKAGVLVVLLAFAIGTAGCGGGASGTTTLPTGSSGTPPGSYTLTVTASSGSVTQSISLTLTVK